MKWRELAGTAFVFLFVALWSAITGGFDVMFMSNAGRQVVATSYPHVPGQITHSHIESSSDCGGNPTYGVDLEYTYEVDGVTHTGWQYRYGDTKATDNHAATVVSKLPAGTIVEVFYNPRDPADAVLLTGIQGSDLFLLMFSTPFNAVMIGGWYALVALLLQRDRPTGGVPLEQRGSRTHLRMSRFGPLTSAIVTAAGLSFVLMFVIGFWKGFHPPLSLMGGVWAIILSGSAIAHRSTRRSIALGTNDVIIDDEARTITLPPLGNRKTAITYPLTDVASISVDTTAKTYSDGTTWKYTPVITFRNDDGEQHEPLLNWLAEPEARALAAWLTQRLT